MKVRMIPSLDKVQTFESGIHTIVRKYYEYGPAYGIEFVKDGPYDLLAIHAGTTSEIPTGVPVVAHCHGLYWTGDYPDVGLNLHRSNQHVIESIKRADLVTVPSDWVAETFRRDMRFSPNILHHGITADEWWAGGFHDGYIISYAKNRDGIDVCNSDMSTALAASVPQLGFYQTFAKQELENLTVTGVLPRTSQYRGLVQRAAVFVSPVKETFGIAVLEAMAAGVPVLTCDRGHAPHLVQHGVGGYVYRDGDLEDMMRGLDYCLRNRDVLSSNAYALASQYSWDSVVEDLAVVYSNAIDAYNRNTHDVAVVIPYYNKPVDELRRAAFSVLSQTRPISELVIVDDGSSGEYRQAVDDLYRDELAPGGRVRIIRQENQGVAKARNAGVRATSAEYVICLDADDWLAETFVDTTAAALDADPSLGIAFTKITLVQPDGSAIISSWPDGFDYDRSLGGHNQIPTACMFRRKMFDRLGGYRQRFAPAGAGEEDAEFWLRAGAYGWNAKQVSNEGLFIYSYRTGLVSGNRMHVRTDYRAWHPWTKDGQHPFASVAKPRNDLAHPVRQYDEPSVSVIIPVGPGHVKFLEGALDSLEAQTFRDWEVIVVFDCEASELSADIARAYPYIRAYPTPSSGSGAGVARNIGVEKARSDFILFLDVDDSLYPTCLKKMVMGWNETQAGIYTDYVGLSVVEDVEKLDPKLQRRVLHRNNRTGESVIAHRAFDYDPKRAATMPANPPYLWCNVTTLIPKAWHDEIGGFDEDMVSWEDIDYWWRMAWAGKPFFRIPEELMVYRFHTGSRREAGLNQWDKLLEYMKSKKETSDGLRVQGQ